MHKKSVFVRYFLLILLLVFVLLLLFSVYIFHLTSEHYKDRQQLSTRSLLMQATERVDNTLYLVNRMAVSTASNTDITASAIAPSTGNQQRNYSILTVLNSLAADNVYITRAYLYEHTKGTVYTSDSDITTLDGMANSAIVTNCLYTDKYVCLSTEHNRYNSRIVQDGHKLFLVYDSIYTNDGPLNTLILELDKSELFSSLVSTLAIDKASVTVSAGNVTPIFTGGNEGNSNADSIITYTSAYTGWSYTLHTGLTGTVFDIAGNIRQLLPFLCVLLLVSLLLAYFITRRAYRPIARLTDLVGGKTRTASVNEFDYLEGAYHQLISDNEAAESVIQAVQPELEETLLTDLLSGKDSTGDDLTKYLTRIHSSLSVTGKYQVILFEVSQTQDMDFLALRVCMMHCRQLAEQLFPTDQSTIRYVPDTDHRFRMVAVYSQDCSIAQIKRLLRAYTETLNAELVKAGITCTFTFGSVCSSLPDIAVSYRSALEDLRQKLYYHNENDAGEKPASASDEYCKALIVRIGGYIAEMDIPHARIFVEQLLSVLKTSVKDVSQMYACSEQMIDMMLEKLLPYRLEASEDITTASSDIYEHLRSAATADELLKVLQKETDALLSVFETEAQNRQSRMVVRAKEYIGANYSDCDLSINDIAEHLDYSPAYLSGVFSKYTGESLVSYLSHCRVTAAKDLLINSQILIKDIGFKAGFNTIQNFNRVFKKETGLTPNEYRKANKP